MRSIRRRTMTLALCVAGASGLAPVPTAAARATAAACGTVPQAEQSARARLNTFFGAIERRNPRVARSVLALHRGPHPERFIVTFTLWHLKAGTTTSESEVTFRSHRGRAQVFDAWVRARKRDFEVLVVDGAYVQGGTISLAVTADLALGTAIRHYSGKAVFDCAQNRYVFLQLGRLVT